MSFRFRMPGHVRAALLLLIADWLSFERDRPNFEIAPAQSAPGGDTDQLAELQAQFMAFRARLASLAQSWCRDANTIISNSDDPIRELYNKVITGHDIADLRKNKRTSAHFEVFTNIIMRTSCNTCDIKQKDCCWTPNRYWDYANNRKHYNREETCEYLFIKMFDLWIQYARFGYEDILKDLHIKQPIVVIELKYGTTPESLRKDINVTAKTNYKKESFTSNIDATISQGFNVTSLLALPYILFHELFCHIYEGIGSNQFGSHDDYRPDCLFSEAWMDQVALDCLVNATRTTNSLGDIFHNSELDAISLGIELFKTRYGDHILRANAKREACRTYLRLKDAIRQYEPLFEGFAFGSRLGMPLAECVATYISFLVNVTGTLDEREQFVKLSSHFLPLNLKAEGAKQRVEHYIHAILTFIALKDINNLINILEEARINSGL
jgi:hypothetical protein